MTFNLRIATLSDVSIITELYNTDTNLFGENETGYEEADIREYITDPRKKMFICISKETIVGALLGEYHDTYVYLDTIIVRKEFQGSGVGKLLMDHFENDVRAMNIPLIESLTEVGNKKMQSFFESRKYSKGNTFIFYSKKI